MQDGPRRRSVFAGQQDGVVRNPKGDARHRKIRVVQRLLINGVAVAVLANEGAGVVGIDDQLPALEGLRRHGLFIPLRQRDFVQQPVSPPCVRNMLGPVREQHGAIERVPIPVFGAGELPQHGLGKLVCLGHWSSLSLFGCGFIRRWNLGVAETGVCKRQAPSQGTATQRPLRRLRARASVVVGGRRLTGAEGQRALSRGRVCGPRM